MTPPSFEQLPFQVFCRRDALYSVDKNIFMGVGGIFPGSEPLLLGDIPQYLVEMKQIHLVYIERCFRSVSQFQ